MPVDVASAASAAGTGFMVGGLPGGIIGLGVGILTGILGMGESPSEEGFRKMFDELYENMVKLIESENSISHFRPSSDRLALIAKKGADILLATAEDDLGNFSE